MNTSSIRIAVAASMLLAVSMSCMADSPRLFGQREFTCADFAETVNYYVDLGETAALADFAMRESDGEKYSRKGFDLTGRIVMLCRVLYEPKSTQPLRDAMMGAFELPYMSMPASKWPMYPVTKAGQSYFVLSDGRILGGRAETLSNYLKYCAGSGVFRTKKVRVPTRAEAMSDVQLLHSSEAWKEIKWKWKGDPGNYYDFSEDWTWKYILKQASTIPAPPATTTTHGKG